MVDPKLIGGRKALKRAVAATPKPVTPTAPTPVAPDLTSFGSLAFELNSPTSSVGQLNRSKEFMEGFQASKLGQGKGRNPYPLLSNDFDEWRDGWECKFYGEAL